MILYPKYEGSGPVVFEKNIFENCILKPIGTFLTTLQEGHPGIIPVRFYQFVLLDEKLIEDSPI